MDLTAWLLRRTPVRPLVVTAPGGTWARLAVERWSREHGWRAAHSPAEANLLVIAGPAASALSAHLDLTWNSMPAPRARARVQDPSDAAEALTAAMTALCDPDLQRGDASQAVRSGRLPQGSGEHSPSMSSCGSGMHDHGGHMTDMTMPGDVPMADRGGDRDGLKLDQLHVPLGPVLPDWPPGLVVHTTLQGDVIQHAHVELLGDDHSDIPLPMLAHSLDNATRLLSVAGWPDMAVRAQRLRDEVLAGGRPVELVRWAARIRRSRMLRWLLSGVGATDHGDALTRLYGWLNEEITPTPVNALPALLEGAELATARLVVASLDLRLRTVEVHG
ncbi:hypothetical protein ABZ345_17650 [Lentzea sp. NPDC005914]|uniref:hypothetical protein n=1 Tax=Lentzea sp. NPDC005914 TaxID=3154572 RepID=UPI0033DE2015